MTVQHISFYILLVLVTIAFTAVLLPFYSAIFWGKCGQAQAEESVNC